MEPSGNGLPEPILRKRRNAPTVSSSVTSSDSGTLSSGAVISAQRTELHLESAIGVSSPIPHSASPATPSIPSASLHSTSNSISHSSSGIMQANVPYTQSTSFKCTLQSRRNAQTGERYSCIHHEGRRSEESRPTHGSSFYLAS